MSGTRSFGRVARGLSFLGLLGAGLLAGGPARAVEFVLGFEAPEEVRGSPGDVKTFDVFATLTTTANETPDGAQGWSYVLGAMGGTITRVALKGVVVSTIYDQNLLDPNVGPIHHDPYPMDVGDSFTKIGHVCTATKNGGNLGKVVFSAIVLNGQEKMVLQPAGVQRLARITVKATVPAGGCGEVMLFYVQNADVVCLDATGNRLGCGGATSVITYNGTSVQPAEETRAVRLCVSSFRRGDSNGDGRVDISDAIGTLAFLFLGGDEPGCRDAADSNDDAAVDLSDPILLLQRLFNRGPNTEIPPPGIYGCGPDPLSDALSCESYPLCP